MPNLADPLQQAACKKCASTARRAPRHSGFKSQQQLGSRSRWSSLSEEIEIFSKEELFKVPILSYIIRHLGAIPVSRQDEHKAGVILRTLLEILSRGEDILIFPEGSRSFDGKLQPMEGGVAMLASHAKAPILPVCVKGTFEAMPRGSSVPKPKKIEVIFGRLIDPLDLPDDMKEKEKRLYVLDQLEQQMKEMMLKLG